MSPVKRIKSIGYFRVCCLLEHQWSANRSWIFYFFGDDGNWYFLYFLVQRYLYFYIL